MARPKDVFNRKKRTKTIILTPKAMLALTRYRQKKIMEFDFSAWVSRKIETELGSMNEEDYILADMIHLQEERDQLAQKYEKQITALANRLSKIRQKESNTVSMEHSEKGNLCTEVEE